MTELKITKGSANVFEDLGFDIQESQNLLLRSQTMVALVQWFNASGLTQAAAAKTLGGLNPGSVNCSRARSKSSASMPWSTWPPVQACAWA